MKIENMIEISAAQGIPNSHTCGFIIKDFSEKMKKAQPGKTFMSEEFNINFAKLRVDLYLAGDFSSASDHLSLTLNNKSDGMVWACLEISVKSGVIFSSWPAGNVLQSKDVGDFTMRSCGMSKCIPHARCTEEDLLYPGGTLILTVRVDLLAWSSSSGQILDSIGAQRQLAIQKRKLDQLDTELTNMKCKVKRLESGEECRATFMTEKCPMCKKDVRKPMRLQQCARVCLLFNNILFTL